MKSVNFILHGSFGFPSENWFPWLHNILVQKGQRCLVPAFPTPDGQTFENWSLVLDAYKNMGLIAEETTFIAHSSAAIFVVKYALSRNIACKQLVTVAGFNNFFSGNADIDKLNADFFVPTQELGIAKLSFQFIDCIYSSSDPYLPVPTLQSFATDIKGVPHHFDNAGHFNAAAGYQSFEAILPLLR